MVQLHFFASLRETLGVADEAITLPEDVSDVAGLTHWLRGRGGSWDKALSDQRLHVAVNQEIVRPESPVHDGDEVAWFPPVTGG